MVHQKNGHPEVGARFFCHRRQGLEGEAGVNDSPADCQSRGRPSAQFARERALDGPPKNGHPEAGARFFAIGVKGSKGKRE